MADGGLFRISCQGWKNSCLTLYIIILLHNFLFSAYINLPIDRFDIFRYNNHGYFNMKENRGLRKTLEQQRSNQTPASNSEKLGTMPVGKLLLSMALPMIIAMIIQALYNVVDSIYVAKISENALTAVSLAFPMQTLMIAFSTGLGVGINSMVSRSLGEGDHKKAGHVALNGIFLIALVVIGFTLVGIFGSRAFIASQTDIPEIFEGGTTYVSICLILCCFQFFEITLERLLQATGRTLDTMISQGVGAVINIIFDPILIFGYFGFPKMGIAGAAAATVFGQFVACVLALVFNLWHNKELSFSFRGFRPRWSILKLILAIGVPSVIMQAIGSVMIFGMNRILMSFVSTAAAVFGVYFKLQSIVFMPVFGLNNGMVPIIAYNYGARHKDRMVHTMKLAVLTAVVMMLVGLCIMQLFPAQMLLLFEAEENMLAIGVLALKTLSLSFIFAGFCIVISSVFQALGFGIYSLLVSFVRQIIVLLPVAYLLSLSGDVNMVWWAFPIAEIATVLCCLLFLRRVNRKVLKPMEKAVTA